MNYAFNYPVIIHKDKDSSYRITVPDFPGCFSEGDTLQEALRNIEESLDDAELADIVRKRCGEAVIEVSVDDL